MTLVPWRRMLRTTNKQKTKEKKTKRNMKNIIKTRERERERENTETKTAQPALLGDTLAIGGHSLGFHAPVFWGAREANLASSI